MNSAGNTSKTNDKYGVKRYEDRMYIDLDSGDGYDVVAMDLGLSEKGKRGRRYVLREVWHRSPQTVVGAVGIYRMEYWIGWQPFLFIDMRRDGLQS